MFSGKYPTVRLIIFVYIPGISHCCFYYFTAMYRKLFVFKGGMLFTLLSTLLIAFAGCRSTQTGPAAYVNPLIDTKSPRWLFFSSACRPFGLVSLSPDTWVYGTWNSGYLYDTTTIRCFSHIHCWQLSGIPVMPVTGEMKGHLGFEACKSRFSHDNEIVKPGYHKVILEDHNISVELTSTCRVGFHRYSFPEGRAGHVLFDIGAELGHGKMDSASIRRMVTVNLPVILSCRQPTGGKNPAKYISLHSSTSRFHHSEDGKGRSAALMLQGNCIMTQMIYMELNAEAMSPIMIREGKLY